MFSAAASFVFLVALAASTVLGASSPSPTGRSSSSSASRRVTVESLSEALEEIVAEVQTETEEVHDIIEKLDEELQEIFPHVHEELEDFEEAFGKRPQYVDLKGFAKIGVESIVDNLLDHLPRDRHQTHHHHHRGDVGGDTSAMPRMKQQHLGLGEILGIGRSKKRVEEVEDRDDGAPKVTAEKMGRFVAAMADLVKDVGFAYNTTPEVVEYDEDGLAAPTVVAAAQRRSDSFSEAEAEAEAEFDVFAGLEDSEDEDLVAIAEGRADYLEEPKLVEVTEEEEEEESLKVERGPDVEEAVTDITRDDIIELHPRMQHEMPEMSQFAKMLNLIAMMGAAMVAALFVMAVVAWTCHKFPERWRHPAGRGYVRVRQHCH